MFHGHMKVSSRFRITLATTVQAARLAIIDPALLERAVQVSGERTKKAAVTKALQEFIARREQTKP